MAVQLEREEMAVPEVRCGIDGELDNLAEAAWLQLCYSRLKEKINERTGRREIPLARVLHKLDIRPFKLESVVRYKAFRLIKQFERTGREWWWHQVRLHAFPGDIPEFCLRKAIQVEEGLYKADIFSFALHIEYLTDQANRIADPFLVVQVDKMRCYIEVFEEPVFEAEIFKGE